MSTSAPPRLELRAVALDAGGHRIVDGLDLVVAAGEIVALVAPSGRGKTTVLRAIVRLGDQAAGAIEIDGVANTDGPAPALRRRVALVAQHPVLLGPTVADDLAAGAGPGLPRASAGPLLGEVGLPADFASREPEGLSGGEQARVAVARALASDPRVLLLDEPSAALDEVATAALAAALRARAAHGLAILLVTHDPVLLRETAARVVELPHAPAAAAAAMSDALPLAGAPPAEEARGE